MRIYFFVVNVPVVRLVTVVLAVILANSCHQIPVVKSILLAVTALSARNYEPIAKKLTAIVPAPVYAKRFTLTCDVPAPSGTVTTPAVPEALTMFVTTNGTAPQKPLGYCTTLDEPVAHELVLPHKNLMPPRFM